MHAALQSQLGDAKSRLEVVQGKVDSLTASNTELKESKRKFSEAVSDRDVQIEQLRVSVGATNNCTFIQTQIRSLQDEQRLVGLEPIW